jgi:heptosyltransferase I
LNILIVKLSSLGDVVHAMPAVQDLRQIFPQARIDWVVERSFMPLAARCAGVHQTIPLELRAWRRAPFSRQTRLGWRAFRTALRDQAYDLVIDLQGLSKSAWVSWLARLAPGGRRIAMANQTEGSSYEAPSRWVADLAVQLPLRLHAVHRARELCARALGYPVPARLSYGLQVKGERHDADQSRLPVALVHGSSRADKLWPVDSWVALGQRLNALGYGVVLPHGNDAEERQAHAIAGRLQSARVPARLSVDAVLDTFAQCAGVIGVDSGLSHIAVALDLPHVQIYNFDTAWRTGPQNRPWQVSVFRPAGPAVEEVWAAWMAVSSEPR